MNFKNKVVVITGGSSGIGKALIHQLLMQGAYVATCARNAAKLYELETMANNPNLFTCVVDVAKNEDCQKFCHEVIRRFDTIDVFIHNAGISMKGLVENTHPTIIRKLMEVNFLGVVQCNYYFLPELIKSKGIIVGISSIGGSVGLPGRAGYSASKFALQGWLESLRVEMMHKEVHVMWIQPHFVQSNIRYDALNTQGEKMNTTFLDEKNIMTAEHCAEIIIKAIKKRKRTKTITFQGRMIIFLRKFFPKISDILIRKFYFKNNTLIK